MKGVLNNEEIDSIFSKSSQIFHSPTNKENEDSNFKPTISPLNQTVKINPDQAEKVADCNNGIDHIYSMRGINKLLILEMNRLKKQIFFERWKNEISKNVSSLPFDSPTPKKRRRQGTEITTPSMRILPTPLSLKGGFGRDPRKEEDDESEVASLLKKISLHRQSRDSEEKKQEEEEKGGSEVEEKNIVGISKSNRSTPLTQNPGVQGKIQEWRDKYS